MPIMDHLGELRRRLTIIVVSLLTVAVIVYFATPTLIDIMIDQIREAMRGGDLYVLTALGGFTIRFKVAVFFAMIICTPIIIWEVMAFIMPALLDQSFEFANNLADAEDYLNIYMLLEVGFGIAFELPLVIFYLSILHIVPYKTFRSQWRYIYVGLMVLSAVVTPDASPVTMVLMFAALIGLYEVALAIARYVIIARDGKQALKWTREDYENAELDKL